MSTRIHTCERARAQLVVHAQLMARRRANDRAVAARRVQCVRTWRSRGGAAGDQAHCIRLYARTHTRDATHALVSCRMRMPSTTRVSLAVGRRQLASKLSL